MQLILAVKNNSGSLVGISNGESGRKPFVCKFRRSQHMVTHPSQVIDSASLQGLLLGATDESAPDHQPGYLPKNSP